MEGPGIGAIFDLADTNTIGNGEQYTININSDLFRGQQAEIKRKEGVFVMVSNSSANVLVNGQRDCFKNLFSFDNLIKFG